MKTLSNLIELQLQVAITPVKEFLIDLIKPLILGYLNLKRMKNLTNLIKLHLQVAITSVYHLIQRTKK